VRVTEALGADTGVRSSGTSRIREGSRSMRTPGMAGPVGISRTAWLGPHDRVAPHQMTSEPRPREYSPR
jgi:hypothetical protein